MSLSALVVDPTHRNLGRVTASLLQANLVEAYFYDGNVKSKVGDFNRPVRLPSDFSVLVLHNSDEDTWKRLGLTANKIVRYTTADPPSLPHESEIWVNRAITDDQPITVNEAAQIVNWIRSCVKDPDAPLPPVLRPLSSQSILPAIHLLCQGYLALHADLVTGLPDISNKNPAYALCKRALAGMRWQEFISQSGKDLLSDLHDPQKRKELQNTVSDPSWWRVTYKINLINEAKEEWGDSYHNDWLKVETLLKHIHPNGSGHHIGPITVAEAYSAISKRVGGES